MGNGKLSCLFLFLLGVIYSRCFDVLVEEGMAKESIGSERAMFDVYYSSKA
jgi:hypothetical protein